MQASTKAATAEMRLQMEGSKLQCKGTREKGKDPHLQLRFWAFSKKEAGLAF